MTEEPEKQTRREILAPLWLRDSFRGIGWEVALPSHSIICDGQDWIRMWWAGKGEPLLPGGPAKLPDQVT